MGNLRNLSIIFLFLSYTCLFLCINSTSTIRFQRTEAEKYLPLPAGAAFKIALFADLHFGENAWIDWGPRQDVNPIRVMSNVLSHETPGLNNGMVNRWATTFLKQNIATTKAPDSKKFYVSQDRPCHNNLFGIPWVTVFGNHDDAAFEWQMEWFSPPGIPQLRCPAANSSCPSDL